MVISHVCHITLYTASDSTRVCRLVINILLITCICCLNFLLLSSYCHILSDSITGVKLYLAELVSVIKTSLSAQSWSVKKQSGAALASLAEKIGNSAI